MVSGTLRLKNHVCIFVLEIKRIIRSWNYGGSQKITYQLSRVALRLQAWVNPLVEVAQDVRHLVVKDRVITEVDLRVHSVSVPHRVYLQGFHGQKVYVNAIYEVKSEVN